MLVGRTARTGAGRTSRTGAGAGAGAASCSHLSVRVSLRFCSIAAASSLSKYFSKIPWKHRSKAVQESRIALTEYLHATRSVPFLYADYIATNSPHSLSRIMSKIEFSPSTFACSFQRFLRYHPINELDFFFESIGLDREENGAPIALFPPNIFFLSDWKNFNVFCALAGMGFPWNKMGLLCKDEKLICDVEPRELEGKINEIRDEYGFDNVVVISICLAFPGVFCSRMDGLLSDLKILFVDYGLPSSVDNNVDAVLQFCEKVKTFYDLGCEMGKVGELMGRSKSIFMQYPKELLVSKIEYFSKLNVQKDQIGMLFLSRPDILSFDLETRIISVSGFLKHLGLRRSKLKTLKQKYPQVFGRNKIANLPFVLRSMDLGDWFFERMRCGDPSLLNTYAICPNEDLDKKYMDNLMKIHAMRTQYHVLKKLNFLHSIGFGENVYAMKTLGLLNSNASELQQRFDSLVDFGIEYSRLSALLRRSAKILNQQKSFLLKKLEFLCNDIGLSVEYLDVFPGYLCFDLEKRIKPRYRLHKWVMEQGLCNKNYSLATIIASSEKTFIARVSRIHPAAAKKWEETLSKKSGSARSYVS